MRLPRRVPWTSITELDQVCAWVYNDEHDMQANILAINRLSAWKVITPLPHALESTLALLVVIHHDKTSVPQSNYLILRHSYAAAIIRFVNGLVDPLQLGAYARSIASIAAQLGLPAWLVELRHAATHEDLPGLELLREAARQSMIWLLHNYFLPIVNPASSPHHEAPSLRPLAPILKRYKAILKSISRDVSLRTRYKQEVNEIMRDIERWISEAKVTANIVIGEVGWEASETSPEGPLTGEGDDNMDIDPKEKWALERFCDALLEKGGLVPLSKKKRNFPVDKFWPPQLSISLWAPLLKHIQVFHPHLAHILCGSILSIFLPIESPNTATPFIDVDVAQGETKNDPSYEMCLARWVMWSLDTWLEPDHEDDLRVDLAKDVVSSLMQALGHELGNSRTKSDKAAMALLRAICSQKPAYKVAVEFLQKPSHQLVPKEWADQDLTTMKARLAQLVSSAPKKVDPLPTLESTPSLASTSLSDDHPPALEVSENDSLPNGWRRVGTESWRACPIGMFSQI